MKARTRKKRGPRWLRTLFFLAIVTSVIGAGAYILSLPIWQIKDVVVNGTKMLSAEEIKALAGIPISENLFFTSFSRPRSNLSKITAIKSFRIYRIPPATVLISITEREPIAAVVLSDKSAIVDREGYILNRNPGMALNVPNLPDLPVIFGINEKEALKNDKIDEKVSGLIDDIILKLSPFMESRKIQLELGGFEKISFILDDLLRVKVGDAQDIRKKMEVFLALLPKIAGRWQQVEYVDVRYPDNPVIKFK